LNILANVTPFAKVYTDEAVAYDGLSRNYIHKVINHSVNTFAGRFTRTESRISGHCSSGLSREPTLQLSLFILTSI
jgi:hypothetical protein